MQTYKMTKKLVEILDWIIFAADDSHYKWVDIPETGPRWMIRDRTYNRLRFWGLIEKRPVSTDANPTKLGLWRPTMLGLEWTRNQKVIPFEVYVLKGEAIGFGKRNVMVGDIKR